MSSCELSLFLDRLRSSGDTVRIHLIKTDSGKIVWYIRKVFLHPPLFINSCYLCSWCFASARKWSLSSLKIEPWVRASLSPLQESPKSLSRRWWEFYHGWVSLCWEVRVANSPTPSRLAPYLCAQSMPACKYWHCIVPCWARLARPTPQPSWRVSAWMPNELSQSSEHYHHSGLVVSLVATEPSLFHRGRGGHPVTFYRWQCRSL